MKPDFFTDNFLADERRHPVTQIGTNATRAAATNAMRNHIWDNFSSETYKTLPAIPPFEVDNPYSPTGKSTITMEAGGPGYYRPPSLISLWSSAPYLHNNTVGIDPTKASKGDVSVAARMKAFQDGIEKMLWIQPRGTLIWKTTKKSYINIPVRISPTFSRRRSSVIRISSTRSPESSARTDSGGDTDQSRGQYESRSRLGRRRAARRAPGRHLDTLARIKQENLTTPVRT